MFPERIETDRLVLERLCHETLDVFEFYRICSDADEYRYTITHEEYRAATG